MHIHFAHIIFFINKLHTSSSRQINISVRSVKQLSSIELTLYHTYTAQHEIEQFHYKSAYKVLNVRRHMKKWQKLAYSLWQN